MNLVAEVGRVTRCAPDLGNRGQRRTGPRPVPGRSGFAVQESNGFPETHCGEDMLRSGAVRFMVFVALSFA